MPANLVQRLPLAPMEHMRYARAVLHAVDGGFGLPVYTPRRVGVCGKALTPKFYDEEFGCGVLVSHCGRSRRGWRWPRTRGSFPDQAQNLPLMKPPLVVPTLIRMLDRAFVYQSQ